MTKTAKEHAHEALRLIALGREAHPARVAEEEEPGSDRVTAIIERLQAELIARSFAAGEAPRGIEALATKAVLSDVFARAAISSRLRELGLSAGD